MPRSHGSGEFLLWEYPLTFWMEKEGYDVSYISNPDTHREPQGLLRGKSFLSVGHDEYWSLEMFNHVKRAVAAGVNAAFFCGNSCYVLIQFFANQAGAPHRALSRIGKFGEDDPDIDRFAGKWKAHGPDPATLMGARSTFPYNGTADWTCTREDHWLFEGTGMRNGDSIPGLVGWEHHGEPAAIPGLQVLAKGPVFSGGRPQRVDYTATIYPGPKGNLVFNAATIWWAVGLSAPPGFLLPAAHGGGPKGPDPRVQRITANLFSRFGAIPLLQPPDAVKAAVGAGDIVDANDNRAVVTIKVAEDIPIDQVAAGEHLIRASALARNRKANTADGGRTDGGNFR